MCSCFHGQHIHGSEKGPLPLLKGRVGVKGTNLVFGCVVATLLLVGVDAYYPWAVRQGWLENLKAWLQIICNFFSIRSHRLPVVIPLFCSWVYVFFIILLASGGQEIISYTSLYISKYFRYGFIGNSIYFGLGIGIIIEYKLVGIERPLQICI